MKLTPKQFVKICEVLNKVPTGEVAALFKPESLPGWHEIATVAENMACEMRADSIGAEALHYFRLDVADFAENQP